MSTGNKITTTGVLYINGAQVENTFTNLSKLTRKLEAELKNLAPGTEEFADKSKQLEEARRRFAEVREEVYAVRESLEDSTPEILSFGDLANYISDRFVTGFSTANLSVKSLGTGIRTMAVQAWAAISSIPIIGWIAALVGVVTLGVREIFNFNNQMAEANKLTQQVTQLQGDALDRLTNRSITLEKVLGLDRKEQLEAARNLVQNFGVTYDEAMDQIERGAIKGGDANNEFIDSLREYPVFFAKAGFSLSEFVDIINAGYDLGIYSDKLPDAIKEFDISIREQTTSTREALVNAFGASFSDELLQKVSKGTITVKDALIEVAKESQKYNLSQKQQAQLTADIFRGAGEDVGGFAKIIESVNLALIAQQEPLTELQQMTKDQIDLDYELAAAKTEALKSDEVLAFQRTMSNFWTRIQTLWYNFIGVLMKFGSYHAATLKAIIISWNLMPIAVSNVFQAIKKDFAQMGTVLSSLGTLMKNVFTFNWDDVASSAQTFQNNLKNSFSNTISTVKGIGKTISGVFVDSYNEADKEITAKANAQRQSNQNDNPTNDFDGSGSGSDKKSNPNKTSDQLKKEQEAELKAAREANEKAIATQDELSQKLLDVQRTHEDEKLKILAESREKAIQEEEIDYTRKVEDLKVQNQTILAEIKKTEDEIAQLQKSESDAKTPEAKAEFSKAIDGLSAANNERRRILSINHQIEEQLEQTHQFKLAKIKEEFDAKDFERWLQLENERINRDRRNNEEEINNISSVEEAKERLKNSQHIKLTKTELDNIRTLEDAKRYLREEANRKMLEAQMESFQAQEAMLLESISKLTDGEAKEKLLADLEALKDKIVQIQGAINGGKESDNTAVVDESDAKKEKVDILGFSAKDWEDTFNNLDTTEGKIAAVGKVFSAMGQLASTFADLQRKIGERDLRNFEKQQDEKKKALLKQLNQGYITQEEYHKNVELLDVQLANKQAEIEYKQAKAEKTARLFSAIGATAQGIASSLAIGGPLGIALAAIVGALGAVQIAAIAAQPLPEKPSFAEGGFFEGYTGDSNLPADETGERPVGNVKLHRKEWVAPRWMTENPKLANTFGWLESVRKSKTVPMAEGGFVENELSVNKIPVESNDNQISTELYLEFKEVMGDVRDLLQKLNDDGVMAYIIEDAENGKKLLKMIKMYEKIEQRASGK